ncbi:MAG: hypothetical protein KQI81_03735 [Deltaproteobacteria bacterium]|nr:hypothetical protein [Deltaproteobacteria bacterium]
MTPQPPPPVHRSPSKRRYATPASCLALILIFSGCASLQLGQFRKHAARGDHQWIAAQAITCRNASEECGQLHLIKGEACFRLAKRDREPAVNFACAADELAEGLTVKASWDDAGVQLQFQQNLCEALSSLRELQSGEAAEQTRVRFFEAARALYRLAPESVSAVYYLSSARLMEMELMLEDIDAATRVPVCIRLKRTVTRVLAVMETARGRTLPDWDRFADDYERLAFDLGAAIREADCR